MLDLTKQVLSTCKQSDYGDAGTLKESHFVFLWENELCSVEPSELLQNLSPPNPFSSAPSSSMPFDLKLILQEIESRVTIEAVAHDRGMNVEIGKCQFCKSAVANCPKQMVTFKV